jgi:16S rRNA (guanine966-N2)-methyltransferase
MRITGGRARSIQLKTLDLPELRPATDQMRQTVFNSLAACIPDCVFIDLFAGCGAVGLEAVSRGAKSGIFVERHPKLAVVIKGNIAAVCKSASVEPFPFQIYQGDVFAFSPAESSCNIVFCDPPYAIIQGNEEKLFALGARALKPGGFFLWEHPAEVSLQATTGFEFVKRLGGKGPRTPNVAVFKRL